MDYLSRLVPENGNYMHFEGNSDAHIKTTIVGASETVFVEKGCLSLGRWQRVFFCEFDGPRNRNVWLKLTVG
jgi:secondary thiamine-phosphate synthase enzyme